MMNRKNCTATKAAHGYEHISRTEISMMTRAELTAYVNSCRNYDEYYNYAEERLCQKPRPMHRT